MLMKSIWVAVALVSWVFGTQLWAAPRTDPESALLSHVRQLTFEGRRSGEGYFSADGSLMIFQSERDAANPFYQIYLMDMETGDVKPVSPGYGKTTCAWVHPSNEKVLYASTHEDPESRRKMRAELEFRASGKERRYAWDYDPHFDLFEQDLATGQMRNLTGTTGYDAEAAYSPDGSLIVFASNRAAYTGGMSREESKIFQHDKSFMMDIYLMASDGTGVRRLTRAPGYDGGPFFGFDGEMITWRRFSKDGSTAEIYVMNLADGKERQVTRMGMMSWAPFFHPSGEYLIFASNREGFGNFELFIVDAGGTGEPVRVTHTDGFDGLPVFHPQGRKLSWTSTRGAGGKSQIFMADWDHAAARRLLGLDREKAQVPAPVPGRDIPATDAAIRAEDARLHVQRLTAEEMEGRLTGSRGERLAAAYVAGVFAQLGLEPAGDQGTYFQAFPFTAGVELGDGNRLEIAAAGQGRGEPILDRDWRPLALSRTGTVKPAGIVFAGYGIVAPGLDNIPDYDAYGDLDVEGKWVMVLRFQPEAVPPEWRRHLLHYSDLAYKASVARRRGAIGMVVVTGPNAQARDRLVELKADATASNSRFSAVSISDLLASSLLDAAGRRLGELQSSLDEGGETVGFEIPGVALSAVIDMEKQGRAGRNVAAVLRSDSPAALPPVMVGAHLDHLGRGEVSGSLARSDERGQIHPGADDNASGVAALLEMAQYLSDRKRQGKLGARRDIWFIAWSGEEIGTLGSSHFVDRLAGKGDLRGKVAAYLNMDMVGHLSEKAYLQGTGSSSVWPREIERRNVPVGLSIATKSDPYLPSDSTPFYTKGVPVLHAFTGAHEGYSTPRDTADRLNYEGIRDIARLMSGITVSLARSETEPDYLEVERKTSGVSRRHLRAYLGTIPAYGQDESVKGVRLQGAVKGAPADLAGIKDGDLLIGLAGVEIGDIHDFMSVLSGLKAGEPTRMKILRDGQPVLLDVVPGSRE